MVLITRKNGGGWWGWWVTSVVAWTWIVVDSTDTANPIVWIDPNLLTSSVTFYATTTASDVSGYTKLVSDIDDPDYDEPAVNVSTWPITGSDQLVWELATIPWLFVGNPWIITITTIWEIRKVSWGLLSNAQFYFKVFHRDNVGTETEIALSNNTMPVTNTVYWQFNTSALLNNWAFDSTDRVVIKFYATRTWVWADPTYEFGFGWNNPVRTLFPLPISVLPTAQQPYLLINSNQNISTGTVYWVDTANWAITLWLNDWNATWQILTVKKIDSSDNSVYVTTSSLIDWETSIEISMEWESYDFYWTGSTFNLK